MSTSTSHPAQGDAPKARLPANSRQSRFTGLVRLSWVLLVLGYAGFMMAELLPQDLRDQRMWPNRVYLALFMAQTFRFHIGVGLLIVVLVAIVARRRLLLAVSAPLVAFALWPALASYAPKPAPAVAGGETLTVMSVNLLSVNRQTEGVIAEIAAADPDLLAIQELNPFWRDALRPLADERYPHRVVVPRPDSFGIALYSRLPFTEPARSDLRIGTLDTPQIRAVIRMNGCEVVVYNIHVMPPTSTRNSIEQRIGIADILDRASDETRPVILCGDFNMTEDSLYAARVRAAGFRDSHALGGFGRGATWPNLGILRLAPGVRIDHIYLSEALTCTASWVGVGRGSDHRPIIAEVAFLER